MGLKEPGLRGSLRNTSSVLPAFFDVTITNTNSPVQEGDILTVDYSADNTGDAQDMQDIRLEIDSVQEDVDPDVMLAGGASTTGTLEWDTTGEPEAEYTATVLSDDDSDSVMVEIGDAIPDDLDNQWRLDEGSGSSISDNIGDVNASLFNDPSWENTNEGVGGFVLNFQNDNEYLETDETFGINGEKYTIIFWIKAEFDGGRYVNAKDSSRENGIGIRDGGNSFELIHMENGSFNDFANAGSDLSPENWYGVVARGDGDNGEIRVYDTDINLLDSDSGTASRGQQDTVLRIMRRIDDAVGARGRLDAPAVSTDTEMSNEDVEEYLSLTVENK